jgi:hypothetical protein
MYTLRKENRSYIYIYSYNRNEVLFFKGNFYKKIISFMKYVTWLSKQHY